MTATQHPVTPSTADATSGPPDDPLVAEAVARIEADGWAVLERVVPDDLVAELRTTIARLLDELGVAHGTNRFLGHRTRRLFNLLARDPVFGRVPVHEPVLAVAERVLDPECLLASLTAITMEPGQEAQPLHADDGSIPLPKPHPPLGCTAIWALTDFTEANGATRVVPGSHRHDRSPRREEQAATVPATMPAGSVLLYHTSLWHGGGENRSDAPREGIVCHHAAGWVRQEENQLLALPRELVATFPPRLRRLVGYGTYRGLLGHVDQRDPAELVDPDATTDMVWRRI
jgi:ectoine hydroxylase-related dioxygenase (phytanoyl-CoA dioxygenase family)